MISLTHFTLILAAFLCTLLAGFLFAFAVVVMPGIKALGDQDYLRAFQVMDRVIQRNQPLFILVWMGSAVAVVAAAVLSIWHLELTAKLLTILAAVLSVAGVQVPTMTINVPLNNRLQKMDLETSDEATLKQLREEYESRWIRWNTIRTVVSSLVSVLLLLALYRG